MYYLRIALPDPHFLLVMFLWLCLHMCFSATESGKGGMKSFLDTLTEDFPKDALME